MTENKETVTCLDCGEQFEKEIAAAWHEEQTGHDNWSDQQEIVGYAIPHITKCYGTRHEAIGEAAIAGREAPDTIGTVQSFTERVTAIHSVPRMTYER